MSDILEIEVGGRKGEYRVSSIDSGGSNLTYVTWVHIEPGENWDAVGLPWLEKALGNADHPARVIRDGKTLFEGTIAALHVNDDTRAVGFGMAWTEENES